MKGLLTYYGGKQKLAAIINEIIPPHTLYAEPFCGGAAVFFYKRPSPVEVLNDSNHELINFYQVIHDDYYSLHEEISKTLHNRQSHQHAWVVYNYPELFSRVKRAWAVWVLSSQSFASSLDGSWGFDITDNTTSRKIQISKYEFSEQYARRLERVQLENSDANYIIRSRDTVDSFFYCDPPYFNSNMGHYRGYTQHDFEMLLATLSRIKGKFLLSSYPSRILQQYAGANHWHQESYEQVVTVNIKSGKGKSKTEMLTANYPMKRLNQLLLF